VAETKKLMKDEYLFKEGDFPDNMYIVRSGNLAVTKTKNKSEVVLAEIAAGAIVGEMALFDKKPRSANVKATKDAEVVSLPYKGLEQQLAQLPEWIRAIVRTLNQNLRDANQRIKVLGQTEKSEDRFSPPQVNKLLSILNFVGHRYGKVDEMGLNVPPGILRKYTIQVFHEATNKMTTVLTALKELGIFDIIDLEDGNQNLINKKPNFLFDFVDWYNDWLMKPETDRVNFSSDEVKILKGIVHFAKKEPVGNNSKRKLSIEQVQTQSKDEVGFVIRPDHFNLLISKALCSDKILVNGAVFVEVIVEDLEKIADYFSFTEGLKPLLK
jgi:CRP/FNR family transcriptional regulator, cyclic AMP receptor protein